MQNVESAVASVAIGALVVAFIIGAVIGALIVGVVMWLIAKYAFKIENASFGGAFVAALAGMGAVVVVEILIVLIFGMSLSLMRILPFINTIIGFIVSSYVLKSKYEIELKTAALVNLVTYLVFLILSFLTRPSVPNM